MIANLARNYSEIDRHQRGKTQTQMAALMLMSVVTELGGCRQIIHPTLTDGTVTMVEFERYTVAGQRLASGTSSSGWDPNHIFEVRYFPSGNRLLREARYPSGETERQALGEGVAGFSATRTGPKTLELRTSFQESKLVRTITVVGYLWTE
jgi:hypothetical protein